MCGTYFSTGSSRTVIGCLLSFLNCWELRFHVIIHQAIQMTLVTMATMVVMKTNMHNVQHLEYLRYGEVHIKLIYKLKCFSCRLDVVQEIVCSQYCRLAGEPPHPPIYCHTYSLCISVATKNCSFIVVILLPLLCLLLK